MKRQSSDIVSNNVGIADIIRIAIVIAIDIGIGMFDFMNWISRIPP
jgi:hypothetical protein